MFPLSLWLLVGACAFVTDKEREDRKDLDGDGAELGADCDDGDPSAHPGASEIPCDGIDQDCAGGDDEDLDADGFTNAACGGVDCDDSRADVYPGADELWYDGVDADCAGDDDLDQDADGHASADHGGTDCDDLDPDASPEAVEVWYDGVDQDCDGRSDFDQDGDGYDRSSECDDEDPTRYPDDTIEERWYNGVDENCDGNDADQDGDGYVPDDYALEHDWAAFNAHLGPGDCWDDPADLAGHETDDGSSVDAAQVNPEASEIWYDGVDGDCDGASDYDQDGDGFDSAFEADAEGLAGDDCVDGSASDAPNPAGVAAADVHPSAVESWYDGTDQDCLGDDDYDQDADGRQVAGYGVGSDDDCDDTLAAVSPDAPESCSTAYDDDCDGDANDDGATGCVTLYVDNDLDGEGGDDSACLCERAGDYVELDAGDCDDSDATIHSDATEIAGDEVDQNCDGRETCYVDSDNDGYSRSSGATTTSSDADCDDSGEASASDEAGDCKDSDSSIYPGATEIVGDGVDQDCDSSETCYADADGDGYRTDETVTSADSDCRDSTEATSSDSSGDCDDTNEDTYPGADEVCSDGEVNTCGEAIDALYSCGWDTVMEADDAESEIYATASYALFGGRLAAIPDLDGDGYSGVAVGAKGYNTYRGAVYVYDGRFTAGRSSYTGYLQRLTGEATNNQFGSAIAGVSDSDGDGGPDLWIGAPFNDTGSTNGGAVYLVPVESSSYSVPGATGALYGETADRAGLALTGLGDLDGDALHDLAVGAPGHTSGGATFGAVYVVLGTSEGDLATVASSTLEGSDEDDDLGAALAAGDLDGDGVEDLIVGCPACETDDGALSDDNGMVFIYLGSSPGDGDAESLADSAYIGEDAGDGAGRAMATGADVDGDGLVDLLIGAPNAAGSGAAALVLGGALATGTTSLSAADAHFIGEDTDDSAGSALGMGDLTGDGMAEILVGAPSADAGIYSYSGASYIVFGGEGAVSRSLMDADVILQGGYTSEEFGSALAVTPDLSGDGYGDLAVGAPLNESYGSSNAGSFYLLHGDGY